MVRAPILLGVLALLADITPKGGDPVFPVEKLGNRFDSKQQAEMENGLPVSVWINLTLNREERWHSTERNEWFIRARPGIFVLTTHEPKEGGWITDPTDRLVWRDREWRRITVKPR